MSSSEYLLAQLPYQLPYLIIYVAGIVLSIVKLRSMVKSAVLALLGCGLLLLASIGSTLLFAYTIGLDSNEMNSWSRIIGVMGTITGSIATALIIAAIFVGRSMPEQPMLTQTPEGVRSPAALAPHRATAVLVLGILSLIVFPPLGIAAWVMGSNDLHAMRNAQMERSGEGITTVGKALGIVGTIVFVVSAVALLLWSVIVLSMP